MFVGVSWRSILQGYRCFEKHFEIGSQFH